MKEGKPCGFLNQSRNEVEPVSPGTLNPEPSQTCGVFGFYLFWFLGFFGGGGVEIGEEGLFEGQGWAGGVSQIP